MGRPLGGDFVQFYTAGKILNQFDPAQMYDLDLEVRLQHQAAPGTSEDQMLVFASAPYVGTIYRPFATLPYTWAYVAWLGIFTRLYSAGVGMLLLSTGLSRQQKTTGFLLGISAMPFLMESWIGGQISVIGFFAVALFVFCRARNHKFLAGMALSLALFKPTLVAIPILMLLCGRRWRMLSGVITGAVALALVSIQTVGIRGCAAWLDTLKFYAKAGLRSCRRRCAATNTWMPVPSSICCLETLRRSPRRWGFWRRWPESRSWATRGGDPLRWSPASRDLLWAATLAGALVCNVYTPIYDTVLVGSGGCAGSGSDAPPERQGAGGVCRVAGSALPGPVDDPIVRRVLRFQPFTLVLAGFAWWTLGVAAASGR